MIRCAIRLRGTAIPGGQSLRFRRGMSFLVVLLVVMVVAILGSQYHQFARQAGAMAARQEKNEIVRGIVESALDEAFANLWERTRTPGTPESAWFQQHSRGSAISVPVPLSAKMALERFRRSSLRIEVPPVQATVVEFQDKDRRGQPFHPREGIGVFQLSAAVRLIQAGGAIDPASANLVRHHDFRVVSLVTDPRNRGGYAHSSILDYALFVRSGIQEFQESGGASCNNAKLTLVIEDQDKQPVEKRGKIYLGGATPPGAAKANPMFFNLSGRFGDLPGLLPALPQQEYSIPLEDCLTLYPSLKDAAAQAGGLTGVFRAELRPIARPDGAFPDREIEEPTKAAILHTLDGAQKNVEPGILRFARTDSLVARPDYLSSIAEGEIYQRFLLMVTFQLNHPQFQKTPCVPLSPGLGSLDATTRQFLEGLQKLDDRGDSPFPLISRFDDGFLYKGGQTYRRKEPIFREFFSPPPGEFQPFYLGLLRFRYFPFQRDFQDQGMFDPARGSLRLRGMVNFEASEAEPEPTLVLEGPGGRPLTFSGKGVLIAFDGIKIKSGIQRDPGAAPDDFLVLLAREGTIDVHTDQKIEAYLIGLSDLPGETVRMIAHAPLRLKGGLAVDRLGTENWAPGEHSIEYDPVFRTAGQEVFQVLPSPQISFQRYAAGVP